MLVQRQWPGWLEDTVFIDRLDGEGHCRFSMNTARTYDAGPIIAAGPGNLGAILAAQCGPGRRHSFGLWCLVLGVLGRAAPATAFAERQANGPELCS